jgi:hypothetical protein
MFDNLVLNACNLCFSLKTRNKLNMGLWVFNTSKWSRVLLEKPIVAHLFENFLEFYRTRSFIAVFTTARHWSLSWVGWIRRHTDTLTTYFFKVHSDACCMLYPTLLSGLYSGNSVTRTDLKCKKIGTYKNYKFNLMILLPVKMNSCVVYQWTWVFGSWKSNVGALQSLFIYKMYLYIFWINNFAKKFQFFVWNLVIQIIRWPEYTSSLIISD